MNVIDKHIVIRFSPYIKKGFVCKDKANEFIQFKNELSKNLGVFFINYMKTKSSNVFNVMLKRKDYTYIYSYDSKTDELLLKGVRKHASA